MDLVREMERLEAIAHNTMVTHDPGFGKSLMDIPDPEAEAKINVQFPILEVVGSTHQGSNATGKRKRESNEGPNQSIKKARLVVNRVEHAADKILHAHTNRRKVTPTPLVQRVTSQWHPRGASSTEVQVSVRPIVHQIQTTNRSDDRKESSTLVNCQWDNTNWSCAYDVLLVPLFHILRDTGIAADMSIASTGT